MQEKELSIFWHLKVFKLINKISWKIKLGENMQETKKRTKLSVIANWIGMALILYSILAFVLPFFGTKAVTAISQNFQADSSGNPPEWLGGIYQLLLQILLILPTLFFLKSMPQKLQPRLPMGQSNIPMLIIIPLFLGASIFLSAIASFIVGFFVQTETSPFPNTAVGILLYFVSFCILQSVMQEFLFRGMIQGMLRSGGVWFSIVTTALFYALMCDDLLTVLNAFFLGLLLSYCREITGSLSACIVLHFVNNIVVFLMKWASSSMSAANAGAAAFMFIIIVIIIILFIAGAWAINYFKLVDRLKIKTYKIKQSNVGKSIKTLFVSPLFSIGFVLVIARFVIASIWL